MNYTFHRLSSAQIGEVTTIIYNTLKNDFKQYKQETVQSYINNILNKKYFLKLLHNKKNAVIGAYAEKTLIGLIIVIAEFGGVVSIGWLVVKTAYRQKGVGTTLLKEAEKWAVKNKFHYAYLRTESDQNIAFYTKRGFRYIGKHTNSWFGENEHLLEKHLQKNTFPEIFTKSLG